MLKDHFMPECSFPIYSNGHTWGQLMGGQPFDMLLDTGAPKCYMSTDFYKKNPQLHTLPKYKTTVKELRMGNGALSPAYFIIPVVFKIVRHKFEMYALVSDIKGSADLVFGMKNMFEVEGELSCRNSEFRFMNRAVPLFSLENISIKPKQKRYVKLAAPFVNYLSGNAIAKITHGNSMKTVRIKLQNNVAVIEIINTSNKVLQFTKEKAMGIVDIRSLVDFTFANFNKLANAHEDMKIAKAKWKRKERIRNEDTNPKKVKVDLVDPYPWLPKDDPRRNISDEEILRKFVDLSKSDMTEEEKEELMELILDHRDAFSLRDEIGECPNITIDIDVIDDSPFFVRPFPISQEDKPIMDWQMQRLVSLGILSKNTTSHTSPVMLITRKIGADKRPVVDFRLLNTRVKRQNTATPLLRDIYQILGDSQSDILTCVDLKDAFHSLKLTDKAKDFCGILPYFGSPHYRYEVMPMGLSISPCKWIKYINYVMENMTHKQNFIAIMDDLLIHSKKKHHMARIADLLKALLKHGLKLSPKKCQFFRTELVYMGNVFKVEKSKFVITPIKTRVEAILNTPTPLTAKECKSFCGVVNYLSLFCQNLQKLLAPIYDLTRKGRPFIWTETHQKTFDTIKQQLAKAPVLSLPDGIGRYILYSDTSKTHAGSALWQMQKGRNRLIRYASKSLPKACVNYGITELEMRGLMVNMENWRFYLGKKDFDAAVDQRAIPYIMQSKELPTTDRIIILLQRLARFNFHLYYVKGKDMILCDFLSRIQADNSDPHGLIPIAFNYIEHVPHPTCEFQAVYFNPKEILTEFYRIEEIVGYAAMKVYGTQQINSYCVMTRGKAQAAGTSVPEVHGHSKPLDPNLKPEKDSTLQKQVFTPTVNPGISTSIPTTSGTMPRVPKAIPPVQLPIKYIPPTPQLMPQTPRKTPQISTAKVTPRSSGSLTPAGGVPTPIKGLVTPTIESTPTHIPQTNKHSIPKSCRMRSFTRGMDLDVPKFDLDDEPQGFIQIPLLGSEPDFRHPSFKAPQQTVAKPATVRDLRGDPFLDPDNEKPLEEAMVEGNFRSPILEDFIIPPTLSEETKGKTILAKNLPKQTDIDRLLAVLNRKILTRSRFPDGLKDLEAAYTHSACFKDVYEYLRYNKLPSNPRKANQTQINANNHFFLGTLLFKIIPNKVGEMNPVLCVPPSKMDMVLDHYHSSLLGGHQGMNKTLMTLQERFFCPRLGDIVRSYIVSCHVCQLFKNSKRFDRPFLQRKYDINQGTMTCISMDIKHMPCSSTGHNYILVMLCEISNFMVTAPMVKATSPEICQVMQDHLICVFGTPVKLICDQDPAFMSHLTQTMLLSYGVKLITVSPTNHKSLLAEHRIKSLSNILMKHLTGLGLDWNIYCKPAMLVYNSYASPNLADFSPFELVFGRKANICPEFEFKPQVPITGTHKQAFEILQKKSYE